MGRHAQALPGKTSKKGVCSLTPSLEESGAWKDPLSLRPYCQVPLLAEICTPDAHHGSSFSVKFNAHWNLEWSWAGLEGPWEAGTLWVWAQGLSQEGGVGRFSSFWSWRWGIPPPLTRQLVGGDRLL